MSSVVSGTWLIDRSLEMGLRFGPVTIDRQGSKEGFSFEFRRASAAAGGVDEGELGGDLDAAAAFGVYISAHPCGR